MALSAELNPIDDARARSCEGVTFRLISETNPELLVSDLERAMGRRPAAVDKPQPERGAMLTAQHIAAAIGKRENEPQPSD